jgi:hypothetical protein
MMIIILMKNNAKWCADDAIYDNAFITGIEFLVQKGIIRID